jgi:hypothetical protein
MLMIVVAQRELDAALARVEAWEPNKERGTLLILDRTIDPVAPLMHEFTYQALVNEIYTMQGEILE